MSACQKVCHWRVFMLQQVLRLMEQELYEEAFQHFQFSKGKSLKDKSSQKNLKNSSDKKFLDEILIEKILKMRTNLRSQDHFEEGLSLNEKDTQNLFLKGEICLLKGLLCYENQLMEDGLKFFELAMKYYTLAESEQRELIAHFNYYVGLSYIHEMSAHQSMTQLGVLEDKARRCQNMKLLGLIIKYKSQSYKQLGKFQAALEEAKFCIPLLEFFGTPYDYNQSLVNASEIALELKNIDLARGFLKQVQQPVQEALEQQFEKMQSILEKH